MPHSITEVYQSATSAPGANNWGAKSTNIAAGGASKYVQLIQTDVNGKVTVTIQGFSPTDRYQRYGGHSGSAESPAGGGRPCRLPLSDVGKHGLRLALWKCGWSTSQPLNPESSWAWLLRG